MMTAAVSKYMFPSSRTSATTDHVHAAMVPTDTNVSIVTVPWRALDNDELWNIQPAHHTTGVANASAHHSQPPNCSALIIDTRSSGTVRTAAGTSRRRTYRAASASGSSAATSGTT
jgi:hypothetical protein